MRYHVTNNKRVITDADIVLWGDIKRASIARVSLPPNTDNTLIVIGNRGIPESRELGHFFGMHIGNGWCDASQSKIHLATIHENQKNLFISYVNAFLRDTNTNGYKLPNSYHDYEGYTSYHGKVSATLKDEVRLGMISTFGHGAYNKTFPLDFIGRGEEFRYGLLSGLIDTDGCVSVRMVLKNGKESQNKIVSYATQSWSLAKMVQLLSMSLGINASISILYRKGRHEFTVVMGTEDIFNRRNHLCLCSGKDKLIDQFIFGDGVTAKDILPFPEHIYQNMRKARSNLPSVLHMAGKRGYITRYSLSTHCMDYEKNMFYDSFDMSFRYDIVVYSRDFPGDDYALTEYEEIKLIEEAFANAKKIA